MAWVYLVLAGLMEVGWPLGLKMSQNPETRWLGTVIAIIFIAMSGTLLMLAQRTIPMGTTYAVWTGIGAIGAFVASIVLYGDAMTFGRLAGILLIISGVIILKLTSGH